MDLPQRRINYRIVPVDNSGVSPVTVGLVLFMLSTYWYKKRNFAKDGNMFNLALFGAGSYVASMGFGEFFFQSPLEEAKKLNNEQELNV